MKLQVTQENLNKALTAVSRVAKDRSTLPILSNVLIRTDQNRCSVGATNLDIAITQFIGAKVVKNGSITVPARLMHDFVASLPAGVIDMELNEHRLTITSEHYHSTINGVLADEFPVMPTITKGKEWKINAAKLRRALQQTILAASSDEARPVLTGVLLHTESGHVYMVATDSYRLAEKKLQKSSDELKLLLPATALQDLLRVMGEDEETVSLTHDDQQVLFQTSDTEIVTRLIEGTFPSYRQLLPTGFTTTAELKRSELLNITKVSSLFARESAGSVTLNVDQADQLISIHSIASQLGENTSQAAATIDGGGEITLNSRYLLEALQAFNGQDIKVAFNGKLDPCVLSDPKDPDYTHLIMPLKS